MIEVIKEYLTKLMSLYDFVEVLKNVGLYIAVVVILARTFYQTKYCQEQLFKLKTYIGIQYLKFRMSLNINNSYRAFYNVFFKISSNRYMKVDAIIFSRKEVFLIKTLPLRGELEFHTDYWTQKNIPTSLFARMLLQLESVISSMVVNIPFSDRFEELKTKKEKEIHFINPIKEMKENFSEFLNNINIPYQYNKENIHFMIVVPNNVKLFTETKQRVYKFKNILHFIKKKRDSTFSQNELKVIAEHIEMRIVHQNNYKKIYSDKVKRDEYLAKRKFEKQNQRKQIKEIKESQRETNEKTKQMVSMLKATSQPTIPLGDHTEPRKFKNPPPKFKTRKDRQDSM